MAVHDTLDLWKKYFILYDPDVSGVLVMTAICGLAELSLRNQVFPGALVTITELLWRPIARIKDLRVQLDSPVPFSHREIVAVLERLLRSAHCGNKRCIPADVGRNTGISSSLLANGWPCVNPKVLSLRMLTLNLYEYGKGTSAGKLQLAHVSAAPDVIKCRFKTFAQQEFELLLVKEKVSRSGVVPTAILTRMVKVLVDDIGRSHVEPMIVKMAAKRSAIYRRDIDNIALVLAGTPIKVNGDTSWPEHQRAAVAEGIRENADEMDKQMKDAIDGWKNVARHSWSKGFDTEALLELNFPFESFVDADQENWEEVLTTRLFKDRGLTYDRLARAILREAIPDLVACPSTVKAVGHPRESPWMLQIVTLYEAFCYEGPPSDRVATGFGSETLVSLMAEHLRSEELESWPRGAPNQHSDVRPDYTRFLRLGVTGVVTQAQEVEPVLTPQDLEVRDRREVIQFLRIDLSSKAEPKAFLKMFEPYLDERGKEPERGRYLRRILETYDWQNPAHKVFALRALTYTSHRDRFFPCYDGRRNQGLGKKLPARSTLKAVYIKSFKAHRSPDTLVAVFVAYMLLWSTRSLQIKLATECETEDVFDDDKNRKLDLRIFHLAGLLDVDYTQVKSAKMFPTPGRDNRGIRMRFTSAADWTLLWREEVLKWESGEYYKLLTWCYPEGMAREMVADWTESEERMDAEEMT
ncbi:hypothetical protein P7C70_g8921, partial [Phenoliferia sp. Uapishka_3]